MRYSPAASGTETDDGFISSPSRRVHDSTAVFAVSSPAVSGVTGVAVHVDVDDVGVGDRGGEPSEGEGMGVALSTAAVAAVAPPRPIPSLPTSPRGGESGTLTCSDAAVAAAAGAEIEANNAAGHNSDSNASGAVGNPTPPAPDTEAVAPVLRDESRSAHRQEGWISGASEAVFGTVAGVAGGLAGAIGGVGVATGLAGAIGGMAGEAIGSVVGWSGVLGWWGGGQGEGGGLSAEHGLADAGRRAGSTSVALNGVADKSGAGQGHGDGVAGADEGGEAGGAGVEGAQLADEGRGDEAFDAERVARALEHAGDAPSVDSSSSSSEIPGDGGRDSNAREEQLEGVGAPDGDAVHKWKRGSGSDLCADRPQRALGTPQCPPASSNLANGAHTRHAEIGRGAGSRGRQQQQLANHAGRNRNGTPALPDEPLRKTPSIAAVSEGVLRRSRTAATSNASNHVVDAADTPPLQNVRNFTLDNASPAGGIGVGGEVVAAAPVDGQASEGVVSTDGVQGRLQAARSGSAGVQQPTNGTAGNPGIV